MKFRPFVLRDDINQKQYVDFRVGVEERKPAAWNSIEQLPIELFYYILTHSAVAAGWVAPVVEENEYGEEVTWEWTPQFIDDIPGGEGLWHQWGSLVTDRWIEYKELDPN